MTAINGLPSSPVNALNIINLLKKYYKKQDKIKLIDGRSLPIDYIFVDFSNTIYKFSLYCKNNKDADFRALYKASHKPLIFSGSSGAGKSTLCRYLAYMWACNKLLQQYDSIFFLDFSSLKSRISKEAGYNSSIKEIVIQECLEGDASIDENELSKVINDENSLWIIDNVDDFYDQKSQETPEVIKWILSRPYRILTTQSFLTEEYQSNQHELKNISFNEAQTYIDKFYDANKGTAEKVKTLFEQQPQLRFIIQSPLQLQLLCMLFNSSHIKIPEHSFSITLVYESIINFLYTEYEKKMEVFSEEKEASFWNISYLQHWLEVIAFSQLKTANNIVTYEEINIFLPSAASNSHNLWDNNYVLSPLKALIESKFLQSNNLLMSQSSQFYFCHLSIRDFFIAHYIAKNLDLPMVQNAFRHYKYTNDYKLIWPFVAGLLKNYQYKLKKFWDLMFYNRQQDVLGLSTLSLVISCLNECQYTLDESFKQSLFTQIKPWLMLLFNREADLGYVNELAMLFKNAPLLVRELVPLNELDIKMLSSTSLKNIYEVYLPAWKTCLEYNFLDFSFALLSSMCSKSVYFNSDLAKEVLVTYLKVHSKPAISQKLILILKDIDTDKTIKSVAFAALTVCEQTPEVAEALFQTLKEFSLLEDYDYDGNVCTSLIYYQAVEALYKIEIINNNMLQAILNTLKYENEIYKVAIVVAGNITNLTEDLLDALFAVPKDKVVIPLYDDEGYYQNGEEIQFKIPEEVIQALTKVVSNSADAVSKLLSYSQGKDLIIQKSIIEVLGQISRPPQEVVRFLLSAMENADFDICESAIKAIKKLHSIPPEFIPALLSVPKISSIQYTEDDENSSYCVEEPRQLLFESLREIYNPTVEIVNELVKACTNENELIREAVIQGLASIPELPDQAIQALIVASNDASPRVRKQVAQALMRVNNLSAEVINALLISSLEKNSQTFPYYWDMYDEEYVRYSFVIVNKDVINFLANLKAESKTVLIQTLSEAAKNEEISIRLAAIKVLGYIYPSNEEVLQLIHNALKDKAFEVRIKAIEALLRNNSSHAEAISTLIADIKTFYGQKSYEAINVAKNLSPLPTAIFLVLIDALKAKDRIVIDAAASAIQKVTEFSDELVETLLLHLNRTDKKSETRQLLLNVLSKKIISHNAVKAMFITYLNDKDEEIVLSACKTLANSSEVPHELIEELNLKFESNRSSKDFAIAMTNAFHSIAKQSNPKVSCKIFESLLYIGENCLQKPSSSGFLYLSKQYDGLFNQLKADLALLCNNKNVQAEFINILLSFSSCGNKFAYEVLRGVHILYGEVEAQLLSNFFSTDKRTRQISIQLLGNLEAPNFQMSNKIQQAIRFSLNDKEKEIREAALLVLSRNPSLITEDLIKLIFDKIKTKEAFISEQLIRALKKCPSTEEAVQIILMDLDSRYIHSEATSAINALRNLSYACINLLYQHKDSRAKAKAFEAIGNLPVFSLESMKLILDGLKSNCKEAFKALVKISNNFSDSFKAVAKQDPYSYAESILAINPEVILNCKEARKLVFTAGEFTFELFYDENQEEALISLINEFKQVLHLPEIIRLSMPSSNFGPHESQASYTFNELNMNRNTLFSSTTNNQEQAFQSSLSRC